MSRLFLSVALVGLLASAAFADDKAPATQAAPTAADVLKNPNDAEALNTFVGNNFREILSLMAKDPAAAETKLNELEALLGKVEPTETAAKTLVTRATASLKYVTDQLVLARVNVADLETALTANPDDAEALKKWVQKVSQDLSRSARTEPEAAEKKLAAATEFAAKLGETAKLDATKKTLTAMERTWASVARIIAGGKKLSELVGKEAAPLTVEAWVNGSPLTSTDLEGKVVLLDFWAIWCGPCIATFPHLREWQEQYGDKGLVMIGLTRYYDYEYKDDAERPSKAEGDITAEAEQAMLKKFAEHHKLKHRFAIQPDESLSEYYAVSGIPHVVVIDQQGKVRMVKVGSGEENAKAIGDLLAQLLPAAKTDK